VFCSSRSRHTRFSRDWSSDVCSSDLTRLSGVNRYATAAVIAEEFSSASVVYVATGENFPDALAGAARAGALDGPVLLTRPGSLRSEERSVGEEWRSGRGRFYERS